LEGIIRSVEIAVKMGVQMGTRTKRYRAAFAYVPIAFCLIAQCGCAVVDQFGGRASDYNFQTGDARNTTILLNIMRAAYSEPLAFTDISTVAGTATASGTASASIPSPLNHAASIGAQTATITPSGTASATGTVNVANLDTQEFYYGLQSPLTMQQIAYYLTVKLNEIDSNFLLPLLISDIELTSNGTTVILHNRADNLADFAAFYSAINFLIQNGLSVEQVKKGQPTKVGPMLGLKEAADTRLLAALISAASASGTAQSSSNTASSTSTSSSGSPGGSNGLTLKEVTATGKDGKPVTGPNGKPIVIGYQLEKSSSGSGSGSFRFCFTHLVHPYGILDFSVLTPPTSDTLTIPLGKAYGQPIKSFTATIGKDYYCGNPPPSDQAAAGSRQQAGQGITITTRSLEGIFYYLGEMARTELGIANGQPTSLAIPRNSEEAASGEGFKLFRIERRPPLPGEPWVFYHGAVYSLTVDPSGKRDGSSRVLQVVSDLLALQSSAKSLPVPNLIAITTP
jgi:hypothetical protein